MNDKNYSLLLIAVALLMICTATLYSVFDSPKYNSLQAVMLSTVIIVENEPAAESEVQTNAASSGKININTAPLEELMKLESIGEKKAQAIIDYRNENGNFRNVYELADVKGISTKIVEQNLHLITV